ncbi:MAG TPA: hypothetical protein VFI17_01625 [Solirubrobacterales bacterium]|nr:hypothetical protein [Solirubrobacterales bacterium]
MVPIGFWLFLVTGVVNALTEGDFALFWVGQLVGVVIGALYTGVVVLLAQDERQGRREHAVGDLVRRAAAIWAPLIGVEVIYELGVFGGTLLLVVPGLYLATIWAVSSPVIVVERIGVFEALGRSRHLVRDNGWRVFGLMILTGVLILVPALILLVVVSGAILQVVLNALLGAFLAPFAGLLFAFLYFRLVAIEREREPVPMESAAP